jgi:HSP20 family protein
MSHLRLLDPTFGTDLDTALRRFFSLHPLEREQPMQMRIDVTERPEGYLVKADLPGVRKEDIHVHVDGNMVRIDAEVPPEDDGADKGARKLCAERSTGSLTRAFSLTHAVDDKAVQARYTDGVLTLEMPKKNSAAARRILVE